MACEKYSDSITDLAAGGGNRRQERELLLHAGECEICLEAYQHAKEVFSVLDRSVETLVAGEPSPYFSARLRAHLADRRSSSTGRNFWVPVVTCALVAIFLVLILVSRLPLRTSSNPSVATNASAPALKPETNVTAQILPRTTPNPRPGRTSRAVETQELSQEVLVPRGQLAAALLLRDGVSGGKVDGEQLVAIQNKNASQLEVKPLEIAPLESSHADTSGNDPTRF